MKVGLFWGIAVLALVAVMLGGWWLSYAVSWWLAPWEGKLEARQIIQGDGNFRIVAYERFYNQCSTIQTYEDSLRALNMQIEETEDTRTRNILLTNRTGLQAQRMRAINQYNVDAAKDWTIGQFRDNGLPYEIPAVPFSEGVHTECVR